VGTTFFRFVTDHAFDRQTYGQTDGHTDTFLLASPRWHFMQRGKIATAFCFAKLRRICDSLIFMHRLYYIFVHRVSHGRSKQHV